MHAMPTETLTLVLSVAVLTTVCCSGVMLILGMLWLRHARRSLQRFQDSVIEALTQPSAHHTEPGGSELVARFRVSDGAKTVSILQRGGRRFLEVEGELTHAERDSLERYLRNEGFIE